MSVSYKHVIDVADKGNQYLLGLLFPGYKQTVKALQHEFYSTTFIPYNWNIRGNMKGIAKKKNPSQI